MKVINTNERYVLYSDHVMTYDQLPAKVYTVCFNKMTGFYLEEHSDIEVKEEKVYGVHIEKVLKVFRAFNEFKRNLGVILSGDKGIGKSLFARLLAEKAIENEIPVIIVDSFIPGIASFLESIEQEVLVLFDEFDKTFANIKTSDNEADPQAGLLSLFDGIATGKKLFVITCNNLSKLNDYLINRPGRFHYHFRFDYPSAEEVKEYLMDKLDPKYYGEIDSVILFSKKVNLNYDCLRSIAFELNNGEKFKDAIKDLNIINNDNYRYNLTLQYENGEVLTCEGKCIDMFSQGIEETAYMYSKAGAYICDVTFVPSKAVYDYVHSCSFIKADDLKVDYSEHDDEDDDKNGTYKKVRSSRVIGMSISRIRDKALHYIL